MCIFEGIRGCKNAKKGMKNHFYDIKVDGGEWEEAGSSVLNRLKSGVLGAHCVCHISVVLMGCLDKTGCNLCVFEKLGKFTREMAAPKSGVFVYIIIGGCFCCGAARGGNRLV